MLRFYSGYACVVWVALAGGCRLGSAGSPDAELAAGQWEGFFDPAAVDDRWLESRGIALEVEVIRAPLARVAKLVIASGPREISEAELEAMLGRDCSDPGDRRWNEARCRALGEAECAAGRCSYEHVGNCSGLLAGGGHFVTAAHCVADLLEHPELAERSAVLVAGPDGQPARRLALGSITAGKRDFSHDWVALREREPLDVASIEVEDGGLPPYPTAPLPAVGEPVFVAGYPRVEGRDAQAMAAVGYRAIHGTPSVSFGRLADANAEQRPLCNVDGNQEHWALAAECPAGPVGDTWRGVILAAPFLATFDAINGYSGGPVFDERGRWVGINATLIATTDPQTRYDARTRAVATPVGLALERLAIGLGGDGRR